MRKKRHPRHRIRYVTCGAAPSSIRFTIDTDVAGRYNLRIAYANAGSQNVARRLFANGSRQTIELSPSGGWLRDLAPRIREVRVLLRKGANTIVLEGDQDRRAEFDHFDVSRN